MYYSCFYELSKLRKLRAQIGVAISSDGIKWNKYSNNPIISTNEYTNDYQCAYPYVIKVNDKYYMYYTVTSTDAWWECDKIKVAISSDGLNWVKTGTVLNKSDDESYMEGCSIYCASDGYILLYSSCNKKYGWSIGIATSNNPTGIFTKVNNSFLTKESNINLFDSNGVATPLLYNYKNNTYLFYQGGMMVGNRNPYSLGIAVLNRIK
jgi:predicted GH43/DUF377 family glycosyl hydrolase